MTPAGAEFGVDAAVRVDGPPVMRRVHRVIDDGSRFYEDVFARDAGVRSSAVGALRATAPAGAARDGARSSRRAPTVLAIGARPAVAPLPGVGEVPFLTSETSSGSRGRRRP